MIRVYYGSSAYELDRFMYETIADRMPRDTIVLVPDQYTLQAEEDALKYMRADVLMNLEIMSRTGFQRRVFNQAGAPAGIPVNRYGRYMLLVSVIRELEKEEDPAFFSLFRTGKAGRSAVAHMINEEISELKQYGVTPEELDHLADHFGEGILSGKLSIISEIYRRCRARMLGTFSDTDDLQAETALRAAQYKRLKNCSFWISGFDYMSPDMLELICTISDTAPEVNIVLTGERTGEEEFDLFQYITGMLKNKCTEHGDQYEEQHVPDQYYHPQSPQVRVIKAGNFYDEAETIAADIMELVRDQGLRFRDIAVICNDLEVRGVLMARVFEQYGIPFFMDHKRAVMQEPAIEFICSLIDCVSGKLQFDDVFRMLRTGFTPLTDEECDRLEMYCYRYHIRGGRWKKEFRYGEGEEGSEGLADINRMRQTVYDFVISFVEAFEAQQTVREKMTVLYHFLTERVQMPEQLEQSAAEMEERGLFSYAASSAQVWKIIIDIMDQMVEILGEEELEDSEFSEIIREGFREVEIGIIPSTADQVILGTMHRTRIGSVQALFAAGANDGVLPEEGSAEGLFSDLEKEEMADIFQKPVGRTGMVQSMEQDLSIYRNFGRAGKHLVISWSAQDQNGGELRPSILVRRYLGRYGSDIEELSAAESGDAMRLIQTPRGVISHAAEVFRNAEAGGNRPEDAWMAAALVMSDHPDFLTMKQGLYFSKRTERLSRENVKKLYAKGSGQDLVISPSRIERFIKCPFSYFVQYGLRPFENRPFDVDSRSVGDIFHYCMYRTASDLTTENKEVCDAESRWMTVTREELRAMIAQYVKDFSVTYRDGLFGRSGRESYLRNRIEDAVFLNAAVMVEQVQKGRIKAVYFEKEFGSSRGNAFPPVRLELTEGGAVYIEGKIDRVDLIRSSEDESVNYVRIIDYKTGKDAFKRKEVAEGIRLQLLIYMEGAMGGIENARPAGVFYFPAGEKSEDISEKTAEDVNVYEIKSRLDGVLIQNSDIIEGMDSTLQEGDTSNVIPVKYSKSAYADISRANRLMSSEEFEQMLQDTDQLLKNAAEELAGGSVSAEPKVAGQFNACRFCGYDSICHIRIKGGEAVE